MKIIICDINQNVIDAFNSKPATEMMGIETACKNILDVEADGIVSPANAFGFMDGGIDLVYLTQWPTIQNVVQDAIHKITTFKELLVGEAIGVVIPGTERTMIVAPTMRYPGPIQNIHDVYLATRAAVYCALELHVKTLVMPGMGTLTGRVHPDAAAELMLAGINDARAAYNYASNQSRSMTLPV